MPDLDRPLPHDPRLDPVCGPWSHPWVAHSHGSPTHAYSPPPLHADIHLWEGSCAPPTTHSRHLSLALQTASLPPPQTDIRGKGQLPLQTDNRGKGHPSHGLRSYPQVPPALICIYECTSPSAFSNAPPVVTPLPCCYTLAMLYTPAMPLSPPSHVAPPTLYVTHAESSTYARVDARAAPRGAAARARHAVVGRV